MNKIKIAIFEGKKIRRHWDEKAERWYFSVVDVVAVLSQSVDPRNYWKVLKNRLKSEGSEVVTKCNQLKMRAADGKFYLTDVADTEVMLRLIQSIPSPNAEPFFLKSKEVKIKINFCGLCQNNRYGGIINMKNRDDNQKQNAKPLKRWVIGLGIFSAVLLVTNILTLAVYAPSKNSGKLENADNQYSFSESGAEVC